MGKLVNSKVTVKVAQTEGWVVRVGESGSTQPGFAQDDAIKFGLEVLNSHQ